MQLPPYGFMSSDFAARLGPLAPARWPAAVPFGAWLLAERDLLARHVWPWWDERAGAWAGAAAGGAEHLTRADLALMASISSRWNGKARHAGGKSHAEWFAMEDELTGDWDPRHDLAFHDLPGAKRRMAIAFYNGCDYHFTGSIPFDLKQWLQRPRPWQAALMMGLPSPEHRRSISAWSPSAVSGHGFQGLMGCVAIQASLGLSGRAYGELVRMAVDIGDRRVYAAVHFPSDNAMSWRVALDALHEIGDTALHRFASEAVRGSEIYQAMQQSAGHSACIALVDQRLI